VPRKPTPKAVPVETFKLDADTTVDVWNNPADEGGRGAHTRRKRGDAFNLVLNELNKRLTEQYSTPVRLKLTLRDLLGDRTVDTVAKKFVAPILESHEITLSDTTLWEVASDICKTFQALEMAVKNNAKQLPPLERYSPEYCVRKELEEGTFRRKL
jgi:hypothetical protein